MILHPGILALLLGGAVVLGMTLYAAVLGVRIAARWDPASSSEAQLALERRTFLVSTLVGWALGFEVLSALLFIHTVDDLHPLFAGAMCATGTLNAHPAGWQALAVKIALVFAASLWIAVNRLDQRAEDCPLVRGKYLLLLPVAILVGLDLALQLQYFLGLRPEVITSCCGSLFSTAGSGVAAELAGLPVRPMMGAFYATLLLFLGTVLLCLRRPAAWLRYLLALLAAAAFPVAVASVISFISLYIYELPSHHCPLDLFQKGYGFIGYPLYGSLFAGVVFGLLPGLLRPLRRFSSLAFELERAERRWLTLALGCMLGFALLCSWPVAFGNLTLEGLLSVNS